MNPWLIYFYLKQYLSKNQGNLNPAIIHSNVIYPCAMVGFMLAKHYKAKHIISEHWSKAAQITKHPIFGRLALKTYKKSKAIICVSNFLATKIATATGLCQTKVIPNIIDTKLFSFVSKEPNNHIFRFTCCATWKLPKRLDLIVHSLIKFANLHETEQFVLNIIGEGSQTDELKQIKIPANLSINWEGYIPKKDIVPILHKTNFFLHASETETFSIVTAEALSTGTPVVASNTGALPELIKPSNGVLVENSIDGWLKGLSIIMENHYEHELIAKEFSNRFSPHAVAQSIIEVYNEVLLN
jgi:glycosyltransferase involved in cell wall biosynthesis